jgi:acetyl esterase/lipase
MLALATPPAPDEPLVLNLWPDQPPGDYGNVGPEHFREPWSEDSKGIKWLTAVSRPTLSFHPAPQQINTGTCMIICPGGGYWNLAWDLEGEEVADWLNSLGINAAILKYRVPRRPGQPQQVPAPLPFLDAQRAVSLVRSKATDWQINPARIGIIGFSAGGHLAIATATNFDRRGYEPIDSIDRQSCRPDFAIAAYPGYLVSLGSLTISPDIRTPANTPPIFLVHASDDQVAGPENSLVMFEALRAAKSPAELHIYATGGHGFGVRNGSLPVNQWTNRCADWLRTQHLLDTPKAP